MNKYSKTRNRQNIAILPQKMLIYEQNLKSQNLRKSLILHKFAAKIHGILYLPGQNFYKNPEAAKSRQNMQPRFVPTLSQISPNTGHSPNAFQISPGLRPVLSQIKTKTRPSKNFSPFYDQFWPKYKPKIGQGIRKNSNARPQISDSGAMQTAA